MVSKSSMSKKNKRTTDRGDGSGLFSLFFSIGDAICAEVGQFQDDFDEDDKADDEDEFVVLPGCCDDFGFEDDDSVYENVSVFLRKIHSDGSILRSTESSISYATSIESTTLSDVGIRKSISTGGSQADGEDEPLNMYLVHADDDGHLETTGAIRNRMMTTEEEDQSHSREAGPSPVTATTPFKIVARNVVRMVCTDDDHDEQPTSETSETSEQPYYDCKQFDEGKLTNKKEAFVATDNERDPPTSGQQQDELFDYDTRVLNQLLDSDQIHVVALKDNEETSPSALKSHDMRDDDEAMGNARFTFMQDPIAISDGEKTQQTSHLRNKKDPNDDTTDSKQMGYKRAAIKRIFVKNDDGDDDAMDLEKLQCKSGVIVFSSSDDQVPKMEPHTSPQIIKVGRADTYDDDDDDVFAGLSVDDGSDVFDDVHDDDRDDVNVDDNYIYDYKELGGSEDLQVSPPVEMVSFLHERPKSTHNNDDDEDDTDIALAAKFLDMPPENIAFRPHRTNRATIRIRDKEAYIRTGGKRQITHRAARPHCQISSHSSLTHRKRTSSPSSGRRSFNKQQSGKKTRAMDARGSVISARNSATVRRPTNVRMPSSSIGRRRSYKHVNRKKRWIDARASARRKLLDQNRTKS